MSIIKSERTFGVEIELGAPNEDTLHSLRDVNLSGWHTQHDGSIECEYPVELVSPILKGEKGEKSVLALTDTMQKMKMSASHKSCGMHVHVGGEEFLEEPKVLYFNESEFANYYNNMPIGDSILSVKYMTYRATRALTKCVGTLSQKEYAWMFSNMYHSDRTIYKQKTDKYAVLMGTTNLEILGIKLKDVIVSSAMPVKEMDTFDKDFKTRNNELNREMGAMQQRIMADDEIAIYNKLLEESDARYAEYDKFLKSKLSTNTGGKIAVQVTSDSSFRRLKALFYLYTLYSDVFVGMVPNSRKEGNSYCIAMGDSFILEDIAKLSNMRELKRVWYKAKNEEAVRMHVNNHYDDSRYHDFNFHSLWNHHGTVEIRSHGSTLDPTRILLWASLHQHIVDMVASERITFDKLVVKEKMKNLKEKTLSLIDVLQLPSHLELYVKRLINHFNTMNL